jgi:hypothetical protein
MKPYVGERQKQNGGNTACLAERRGESACDEDRNSIEERFPFLFLQPTK